MPINGPEVIGHRLVGRMPEPPLVELWIKCTSRIVKYGFAIQYQDLAPPRTGVFDGRRIVLDPDIGFEMQCFVLLHLFGHSVQWVAPSIEHKLAELQNTTDKGRFMQVLHGYEYEAAGYGLQLMHEADVRALDRWYSDFVATDWRYVERYYQTDRIPPWQECVVHNQPVLTPLPIPPLVHREVEVRYAF